MRVIKANTKSYEFFHETLPSFTRDNISNGLKPTNYCFNSKRNNYTIYNHNAILELIDLQNKINSSNNITEIEGHLSTYTKNTLKLGESNLYFLDKNNTVIESVSYSANIETKTFINSLLSSGIISRIITDRSHVIIPDNLLKTTKMENAFYLIMPLVNDSKNSGCLVIIVDPSINEDSTEVIMLKAALGIVSRKIELIDKQQELKNVYNELQLFQTRLANDYKLSAIGELTAGILADILSPLQVIISHTGLTTKGDNTGNDAILDTVNAQAKKISRVVNRLTNFTAPASGKLKLQPCDINDTILEFYEVVISTLKTESYECILELGENIPNILSHPNYLNQVLMNVFLLLKPSGNRVGGVLLQSKYQDGQVVIKFFTTDYYSNLELRTQRT